MHKFKVCLKDWHIILFRLIWLHILRNLIRNWFSFKIVQRGLILNMIFLFFQVLLNVIIEPIRLLILDIDWLGYHWQLRLIKVIIIRVRTIVIKLKLIRNLGNNQMIHHIFLSIERNQFMFLRQIDKANLANIKVTSWVPESKRSQQISSSPTEITDKTCSMHDFDLVKRMTVKTSRFGARRLPAIRTIKLMILLITTFRTNSSAKSLFVTGYACFIQHFVVVRVPIYTFESCIVHVKQLMAFVAFVPIEKFLLFLPVIRHKFTAIIVFVKCGERRNIFSTLLRVKRTQKLNLTFNNMGRYNSESCV